jgi:hypothetical protein
MRAIRSDIQHMVEERHLIEMVVVFVVATVAVLGVLGATLLLLASARADPPVV